MDCLLRFRVVVFLSSMLVASGCHVGACRVVHVPAPPQVAVPLVDVTGTVRNPTALPIDPSGLKLWSAIIRSGGAVARNETELARTFVTLHRANCEYHFALPLVEGEFAGDIQLAPGDIVHVNSIDQLLVKRSFLAESASVAEFSDQSTLESIAEKSGHGSLEVWERAFAIAQQEGASLPSQGASLMEIEFSDGIGESPVLGTIAELPVAPGDPELGACDAISASGALRKELSRKSGPSPILLDLHGNAAMVLVVSRDATSHHTDRELFVVPSSLLADSIDSTRFDRAILADFKLRPGDAVSQTNLEQIPIIASSLLAPHIKAEQNRLRNLALQQSQMPRVPFAGVPVVGTVSDCICRLERSCKSVTVETYETPISLPPISMLSVPYASAKDSNTPSVIPQDRCNN